MRFFSRARNRGLLEDVFEIIENREEDFTCWRFWIVRKDFLFRDSKFFESDHRDFCYLVRYFAGVAASTYSSSASIISTA